MYNEKLVKKSYANKDTMDKNYYESVLMAEATGSPIPLSHTCKKCGKETLNHGICEDCIPEIIVKMIKNNQVKNEYEAMEKLYEYECDCWYSANGY